MRKEVWFGLTIMAAVVLAAFILLPPVAQMSNGHLGLLMLAAIPLAAHHLHLPEWLSGLIGIVLLAVALVDSIRHGKPAD